MIIMMDKNEKKEKQKFLSFSLNWIMKYINKYNIQIIIILIIILYVNLIYVIIFYNNISNYFPSLFSLIIGSLITTLAIIFGLSQFLVTNISERYSPKMLDEYENILNKNKYITILTISIFIYFILFILYFVYNEIWFEKVILAIFPLFIICLYAILHFFQYVFTIINPRKFSFYLSKEIKNNIKNIDETNRKNNFSIMKDISIKALSRKEEYVSMEYIERYYNIYNYYNKLLKMDKKYYPNIIDEGMLQKDIVPNVVHDIFNDYLTIYQYSLKENNKHINRRIITNLKNIIFSIINDDRKKIMFKQFYDNDEIVNNKMMQFYEISIINRSDDKYQYISFIWLPLIFTRHISEYYIYHIFRTSLIRLFKIVIKHDDKDLFKEQIRSYSLKAIRSPIDYIETLRGKTFLSINLDMDVIHNDQYYVKLRKYTNELHDIIEINFYRSSQYHLLFNRRCNNILKSIIKDLNSFRDVIDQKKLTNSISVINKKLQYDKEDHLDNLYKIAYRFNISQHIHVSFVIIGGHILNKITNEEFDGVDYIDILWNLTKPKDSTIAWMNKTPVVFDIKWLLYTYFYGNEDNEDWMHNPGFMMDFYQDEKKYITEYIILCIAKCVSMGNKLKIPNKDNLLKYQKENRQKLINEWYNLSNKMISPITQNEILPIIEEIIDNSKIFDKILSYEKNNGERDIVITAKDIFNKTKEYFKLLFEQFGTLHNEIIEIQNIDSEVTEKNFSLFSENYHKDKYDDIVNLSKLKKKDDVPLIIFNELLPKDMFIKPKHFNDDHIFIEFGRKSKIVEMKYYFNQIINNTEIHSIKIKYSTLDDLIIKILEQIIKHPKIRNIVINHRLKSEIRRNMIINKKERIFEIKKINNKEVISYKNRDYYLFTLHPDIIEDNVIQYQDDSFYLSYYYVKESENLFYELTPSEKHPTNIVFRIMTYSKFSITNTDNVKIIKYQKE